MTLQTRAQKLVESAWFERFIITVIVINAIGLGLETSPAVMDVAGGVVSWLDKVALSIFVVELAIKLFAYSIGSAFAAAVNFWIEGNADSALLAGG